MKQLDRPGIFKARALRGHIRTSQQSQAVAVSIEFLILAQYDASAWTDWTQYEEHGIFGDFWVIKSDGSVNVQTAENLARSIGWDGDLDDVVGDLPAITVQITVKEEEYNGRKQLKVGWINPEDFTPAVVAASAEEVTALGRRFGSLLRAAASGAKAAQALPPKATPPPAATQTIEPPPVSDEDLPF